MIQETRTTWGVGLRRMSFVDHSRPIKASHGFAGAPERRLDVLLWHPTGEAAALAAAGPLPLLLYCHGTGGAPDNANFLITDLVQRGYIVAAPNFPLTSHAAFTQVTAPNISDAGEQVRDVRFVLDQLLADPELSPGIDEKRIASIGHSLGAITCWFLSFGAQLRDTRICATVMLAPGDPVVAVTKADFGLADANHLATSVPALLVTAEHDLIATMMGPHGTAFPRLVAPKFEIVIKGAVHFWFIDGDDWPPDNQNPDFLFLSSHMPGISRPSGEQPPLIGPSRQQEITLAAVQAFLDTFLKHDDTALAALRDFPKQFAGTTLDFEV